jgi:integrase
LPKSNKPRVIDLDAKTIKVLKEHRAAQAADKLQLGSRWVDEGLAFARGSYRLADDKTAGGPLHPERTSRLFKARMERHGLPEIRFHDLRHTWATLALKAGVPVKVVQERLGHANPSITMNIYSHALPGMQAERPRRSHRCSPDTSFDTWLHPALHPDKSNGPVTRTFGSVRGGT